MMSAEADRLCEATGSNRNGYRERSLVTYVGTLTPGIPRLRTGSLLPDDATGRCQRCVSSREFEQKEHRKLSSLSIGGAHAF